MSFVVHENHGPHKYTRIHRASCYHARPAGLETDNTRWHPLLGGAYGTYAKAHAAAIACGQPKGPFNCKDCKPDSSTSVSPARGTHA